MANSNFVSSSQEEDDRKIGTSDPAPCILEGYGGCVCPEARLHHCNNPDCEGHGLFHSVCIGALQQRFLVLHQNKISLAQTGLPEDVLQVVNNIDGKCPCHWLPCIRGWCEDSGELFPEASIQVAVEQEVERSQEVIGDIDPATVAFDSQQVFKTEKTDATSSLFFREVNDEDFMHNLGVYFFLARFLSLFLPSSPPARRDGSRRLVQVRARTALLASNALEVGVNGKLVLV